VRRQLVVASAGEQPPVRVIARRYSRMCSARIFTRPSGTYTVRSDPYLGPRISMRPSSVHWTWRARDLPAQELDVGHLQRAGFPAPQTGERTDRDEARVPGLNIVRCPDRGPDLFNGGWSSPRRLPCPRQLYPGSYVACHEPIADGGTEDIADVGEPGPDRRGL